MGQVCSHCSRLNPDEATFCWFDGKALTAGRGGRALDAGSQRFPSPFVFPSGEKCHSFNELATCCWQNWEQVLEALHKGTLERFLGSVGRIDLAMAARHAAEFPDHERGLDRFLGQLPTGVLAPAKLSVDRQELNLGRIKLGEDHTIRLRLRNEGMRLLYGTISCENCVWLTIGEGAGVSSKMFAFTDDLVIPLQVRGQRLRAGNKPLAAQVEIDTNGGTLSVVIQAEVPAKPFPVGALAGAVSPRQVAEKAKASPREAAALFEKGAVAKWYRANGWDYPVKIPAASGIAGIQQFFEALGLTAPPKVEIKPTTIKFKAKAGARLQQAVEVSTQERRAVWAHAVCDQPWLKVTKVSDGKSAILRVDVPKVPDKPGTVLRGRVTILSNGRRRFIVPVIVGIVPRPGQQPASTPEVLPVQQVEEIDETVQVEIVEESKAAPAPPNGTPIEVEVVEEVQTPVPGSLPPVPSSPSTPVGEFQISLPPTESTTADFASNPFAFDDVPSGACKKRKRNTSLFLKIFGWAKKR